MASEPQDGGNSKGIYVLCHTAVLKYGWSNRGVPPCLLSAHKPFFFLAGRARHPRHEGREGRKLLHPALCLLFTWEVLILLFLP